jgi:predicted transcriptional regulator
MTEPTKGQVITVRLPRDLHDALRDVARREDRTVASLLHLAARQYLGQR